MFFLSSAYCYRLFSVTSPPRRSSVLASTSTTSPTRPSPTSPPRTRRAGFRACSSSARAELEQARNPALRVRGGEVGLGRVGDVVDVEARTEERRGGEVTLNRR